MFDKTMVRGLLAVASTTAGRRVATFAGHGPWFRLGNIQIMALVFSVGVAFMAATARGDVFFVVNGGNNTIGEYDTLGATVNASLVSGLGVPQAITTSGSNLFVTNVGDNTVGQGTIGEYTTSGDVVNASLISGLFSPHGIAVSGSNVFVVNSATNSIGEYTTSGDVVNPSLVSGLNSPFGLAVSAPVPEPATLTLLGSALLGLGVVYLRRRGVKAWRPPTSGLPLTRRMAI